MIIKYVISYQNGHNIIEMLPLSSFVKRFILPNYRSVSMNLFCLYDHYVRHDFSKTMVASI